MTLRSPLVAASGTVGSVVEFSETVDFSRYGAAVAKSVAPVPWTGNRSPRMGSSGAGMLNAIGIPNPGIEAWSREIGPRLGSLGVPVWGSAVGHDPDEFATVASGLDRAGVAAVEINLSCPNLGDGRLIALDRQLSAAVVAAVRASTTLPIGAKLSPNSEDITAVAAAVGEAGADWVVLTNTVWGAGFDIETRRPQLSTVIGGYSGPPLKPLALRCVWTVHRDLPELPIVGCGGISTGGDVVEFLLAGASAVEIGTVHFAVPRAAGSILKELRRYLERHGVETVQDLIGAINPW